MTRLRCSVVGVSWVGLPVISALWGLGLLTAISLSLLWSGNVSYGLVRIHVETARANAIAGAAVNQAVTALLDPRPEQRWRTDCAAPSFDFDGIMIEISIQDELGKVDLNQAEAPLLLGLLKSWPRLRFRNPACRQNRGLEEHERPQEPQWCEGSGLL